MTENKCKILLIFLCVVAMLSHSSVIAQLYNESDKEVLRKFGRKPSAVPGKLNIDRMWRSGVPIDTGSWYSNEMWVNNIDGITWDGASPKHILRIEWSNYHGDKLADSIDFTGCDYLDYFRCSGNEITGINVKNNPRLTTIYCGINKLKYLDVTHNPELTVLDFCHNQISSIDVSANTKVTWLCAEYNRLAEINLTGLNVINAIWLRGNKMKFSTLLPKQKNYLIYIMLPQDTILLDTLSVCDAIDFSSENSFSDGSNQIKTNYSWYKLNGTTENLLPTQQIVNNNGIFAFKTITPGWYRCKMTNSAFSSMLPIVYDIYLSENDIIDQPQSQMICHNAEASLSINMLFGNMQCQWQRLENNNMWKNVDSAATNIFHTSLPGVYRAVLNKNYCTTISDTAVIIESEPSFIQQKSSDCIYNPAQTLSVQTHNYVAAYQWRLNGIALCNLPACPITDTGSYVATLTDICGIIDSATIHVGLRPMNVYVNNVLLGADLTATVDCGSELAVVNIYYDSLYHPNIFIDTCQNSKYNYPIPNEGRNYVQLKTIDIKGKKVEYVLKIDKPLNSDIFRTRWDDVLVVPLKIEGVDGLEECTKVEWYKKISDNYSEKIDRLSYKGYLSVKESGSYFVIINDIFRSCLINFILLANAPQIIPNPSSSNVAATLITGLSEEEMASGIRILLVNAFGNIIDDIKTSTSSVQITTPKNSGIYNVIIETKDNLKTVKMVVAN